MPSIQDVADQINAKLDGISTNTANTAANTAATKTAVDQTNAQLTTLDNHLQAGFVNLSQGLSTLIQIQMASLTLQEHNRKQNDTIICLLENTNELLCGITRKFTRQLDLSEAALVALQRIEAITERVSPAAAADYDRLVELEAKIEECCPPDEPEPEPCPEGCPKTEYKPYRPTGAEWVPLGQPARPQTAAGRPATNRKGAPE